MCKTPSLTINNHEDSKLLVEFAIDTLRIREMEITASIQKFIKACILRLPKSPFNPHDIFLEAYIIFQYFWGPIYFILNQKNVRRIFG